MCAAGRRGYDLFYFFNDTATTEIYTLSLHDALPICDARGPARGRARRRCRRAAPWAARAADERARADARGARADRKSTRLNSSHANISYAVFCLKKKKQTHHVARTVNNTYR